jgi:hypothetical protein
LIGWFGGEGGIYERNEWMDGGCSGRKHSELHDAIQIHCYSDAGAGWKEGGAVVGNEHEFATWQNKITVTGWLASPAITIIVIVVEARRGRGGEKE